MSFRLICEHLFSKLNQTKLKSVTSCASSFHTSTVAAGKINRMKDRTALLRTIVKKEDGIRGTESVDLDSVIQRYYMKNMMIIKICSK